MDKKQEPHKCLHGSLISQPVTNGVCRMSNTLTDTAISSSVGAGTNLDKIINADCSGGTDVNEISMPHTVNPNHIYTDELYDTETPVSTVANKSVLRCLAGQLHVGMDMVRISLPIEYLEPRSTLEGYGDFMGNPSHLIDINRGVTPKDRFVSAVKFYLSGFHAVRPTPGIAKKPFNPILGEVFFCHRPIDEHIVMKANPDIPPELNKGGPVEWAPKDNLCFVAEQVEHHPPISAYYFEIPSEGISGSGQFQSKTTFMLLYVSVEMLGKTVINFSQLGENYEFTMPRAYGRNIFSKPWFEFCDTCRLSCNETGFTAKIEFKSEGYLSGKRHAVKASLFCSPHEKHPFMVLEGRWNKNVSACFYDEKGKSISKCKEYLNFVDQVPVKKRVLPRELQGANESRNVWREVVENIKIGNAEKANIMKSGVEDVQRDAAKARHPEEWTPVHFDKVGSEYMYKRPLTLRLQETKKESKDE